MPRFYFDVVGKGAQVQDAEGALLLGLQAAKAEALLRLTLVAPQAMGGEGIGTVSVVVRDRNGAVLLTASLHVQVQYHLERRRSRRLLRPSKLPH